MGIFCFKLPIVHEPRTQTKPTGFPEVSIKDTLTSLEISSTEAVDLLDPHLQGLAKSYFSRVINQPAQWTSKEATRVKRYLCRLVLLPAALALEIEADKAWAQFGEHALFGLPEPNKDRIMAEAARIAEQRRAEAQQETTEEVA